MIDYQVLATNRGTFVLRKRYLSLFALYSEPIPDRFLVRGILYNVQDLLASRVKNDHFSILDSLLDFLFVMD